MQIVIDIPEDTYKRTKFYKEFRDLNDCVLVLKAIDHAIELPKEHGRLIDADAVEYTCNSDECGMLAGCNHCQYNIITEDEIDKAPTIIEADKETQ